MRRAPLLAVLALTTVAGCECGGLAPRALVRVTSGDTRVDVTLAPFGVRAGALATTTGAPGCAPLTLALRAPSDTGAWHKPEAPSGDELWLRSGDAELIDDHTVRVAMLDDSGAQQTRALVSLSPQEHGFVQLDVAFEEDDVDVAYAGACFALASGEHMVGGGERFTGADLRGKITPLYFDAPGPYDSGTNEAHAPVPFFASNLGYAVLVDEERAGAFDIGVTEPAATVVRFHGAALRLAVREGGIADDVAALARRVGLPPAPPDWVLAPMQWRNDVDADVDASGAVTRSGTDKLLADASEMRARGIPTSTIWIDAPWETGYNTFTFNEAQLPGIHAAMAQLEAQGFHVVTWATDNINSSDDSGQAFGMPAFASRDRFEDFARRGLLVTDRNGAPFTFPWGRGTGGFVDFTKRAACDAYRDEMRPLIASGVRGFKLDYGETMVPDILGLLPNDIPHFSDGTSTAVQQARFKRLYHECYLQELEAQWPGNDHFVITRTGGLYDQKNGTAIWPGDLDSGFEIPGDFSAAPAATLVVGGLPAAVGGYLSLAMSAYPLYGSDVGGYRGGAVTPEAFVRWAQFGAVSTVMQVGGGANQAAWDPELVDVIDAFTEAARLHMDLTPMWKEWLARAARDGTPVALPVGAFAGDDEDAWADSYTFVLGADGERAPLLAAPVVEDGARTRELFVPAGSWRSFWDDDVVLTGPGRATVDAPFAHLPLFVNDDAILVLADPRIVTLLDNGDADGGADDMGERRVVRTVVGAGIGAASGLAGDVTVARVPLDAHSVNVAVLADHGRPVVVDLHTIGVSVSADGVAVDGHAAVTAVDDVEALLACPLDAACALVEPGRVRVAAAGRQVSVTVSWP